MTATVNLIEPAYFSAPSYVFSGGPEAVDLAKDVGYPPDGNQTQALDVLLAEDEHGLPVAFEFGLICSRQNIKTSVMKMASLYWLFLAGVGRVVYTAHDWNPVCADMFREMKELIEGSDWLLQRTKRIYEGNGEESIVLHSGSTMLFKTRTKSGARGMAGDKVMFDEGFALQPTHVGSLIPILSTRPQAQIFYGSSPGKSDSDVLRGVRDRGRRGDDPQLAYIEFCAPPPAEACELGDQCDHGRETPGCGCDKPDLWRRANPATASGRISLDYIAKERRALPPAEFARERMGWWDRPGGEAAAIPMPVWLDAEDRASGIDGPVSAFAVATDPEREWSAIGSVGAHCECTVPHGQCDLPAHVELVDHRRGTGWVVDRCITLDRAHGPTRFVVDGGGPAASLISELEAAGLNVLVATTKDVARSYGLFMDAINARPPRLRHGPQEELTAAVQAAKTRPCGDGGQAFGRKVSGADITPLEVVSLAHWAHVTHGPISVLNTIW